MRRKRRLLRLFKWVCLALCLVVLAAGVASHLWGCARVGNVSVFAYHSLIRFEYRVLKPADDSSDAAADLEKIRTNRLVPDGWHFKAISQRDRQQFWSVVSSAKSLIDYLAPQFDVRRGQQQYISDGLLFPVRRARVVADVDTAQFHLWLPLLLLAITTILLFRFDRRPAQGHCEKCGYNLTGNVSGRCPECGMVVSAQVEEPKHEQ